MNKRPIDFPQVIFVKGSNVTFYLVCQWLLLFNFFFKNKAPLLGFSSGLKMTGGSWAERAGLWKVHFEELSCGLTGPG